MPQNSVKAITIGLKYLVVCPFYTYFWYWPADWQLTCGGFWQVCWHRELICDTWLGVNIYHLQEIRKFVHFSKTNLQSFVKMRQMDTPAV